VDLVKSARIHLQSPQESAIIAATARRHVINELGRRAADYADAMPDRWGDAVVDGLTPVQALLVVYSAASDDNLAFRTEELRAAENARSPRDDTGTGDDPLGEVVPSGHGLDADAGDYLQD